MTGAAAALLLAAALVPLDGNEYRRLIESQNGKVTLVDFWATWCGPCRAELPAIAAMPKRIAGLRVLTISIDEPENAESAARIATEAKVHGTAWIRSGGDTDAFIRLVDPKWSGAIPAAFLYDRNGRLVRSFTGETKASVIEGAVRKLLR